MKNIIKTCAFIALTLTLGAASSQARGDHRDNNEAWAALGGFIGGVITAEVLNDHHQYANYSVEYRDRPKHNAGYRDCRPTRCDTPKRDYRRYSNGGDCCGGGYWKVVKRKVWVPGSWSYRWSSCGTHKVRYRTQGYYKVKRERVWISGHSRSCRYR
ncbi:MAG: hypothetical protein AAFX93_02910 [Verrucomicrobiota bacterium]